MCRRGHDDLDLGTSLGQSAHQIRALVRRNAAGDTEEDPLESNRSWADIIRASTKAGKPVVVAVINRFLGSRMPFRTALAMG